MKTGDSQTAAVSEQQWPASAYSEQALLEEGQEVLKKEKEEPLLAPGMLLPEKEAMKLIDAELGVKTATQVRRQNWYMQQEALEKLKLVDEQIRVTSEEERAAREKSAAAGQHQAELASELKNPTLMEKEKKQLSGGRRTIEEQIAQFSSQLELGERKGHEIAADAAVIEKIRVGGAEAGSDAGGGGDLGDVAAAGVRSSSSSSSSQAEEQRAAAALAAAHAAQDAAVRRAADAGDGLVPMPLAENAPAADLVLEDELEASEAAKAATQQLLELQLSLGSELEGAIPST